MSPYRISAMRAEPHSGHFAGFSKYSYRFVMLILKQVVSKTRKTTRRASKPAGGGGRRKISDYPDGSASSLPKYFFIISVNLASLRMPFKSLSSSMYLRLGYPLSRACSRESKASFCGRRGRGDMRSNKLHTPRTVRATGAKALS